MESIEKNLVIGISSISDRNQYEQLRYSIGVANWVPHLHIVLD